MSCPGMHPSAVNRDRIMRSAYRCVIWLAAIGESCRGLISIDMSDDSNITDGGVSCLAQGCIHLQSINIGGSCSELTDASLAWHGCDKIG